MWCRARSCPFASRRGSASTSSRTCGCATRSSGDAFVLGEQLVGGQRQELDELVCERDLLEHAAGLVEARQLRKRGDLLVPDRPDAVAVDATLLQPLPERPARELRRGDAFP